MPSALYKSNRTRAGGGVYWRAMKRLAFFLAAALLSIATPALAADGGADDAGEDSGKPTTQPSQNPKYVDASADGGSETSSSDGDDGGCSVAGGESGLGASIMLLAGLAILIAKKKKAPRA
jgi:hypothetical protein